MGQFVLKNTFTRGECSPLAFARNDIQVYAQSAELIRNFHVLKEGGLRRRSGSRYRGRSKYGNRTARLVPFIYSNTQAFALEMGDEYARFWTGGGYLGGGGLTDDDGTMLFDDDGYTQLADDDEADPYEIVSPYSEDVLAGLQWVHVNDVQYFGSPDGALKPQKLKRYSNTHWAFEEVEFIDGPYLPINDQKNGLSSDDTLDTDETVEFAWESTDGLNGGLGLQSTDVGRQIRAQFGGKWSWGVITAVTDEKTCDVLIKEGNGYGGSGSESLDPGGLFSLAADEVTDAFRATEIGSKNLNKFKTYSWRLGAFSDTTGYPKSVTLFQGRVFWGRTNANPRAVFYSRSNLPDVFSPSDVDGTVTDSHGGMLDIIGARGDEILWLQEAPRLQIGTGSAVRSLGGSDVEQAFSPRNISQRLEVAQGVADVRPELVGPSTIHAGRYGKAIHDLFFDFQANTLVAPNLSVSSEHLFKAGVKEFAFQQKPNETLWTLLDDGSLAATTIERYEKVVGFTRHDLQDGDVQSICCIPGTVQDDPWLLVRREIDGETVQYVETLDPLFDNYFYDRDEAFFVDCGSTYDGAETTTVTGIDWLEGVEVDILADGHALPRATVTDGELVLPNNKRASKISFGIPITARGKLLRAPTAIPDGPALGRKCRVVEVYADLHESLGVQFESDRGTIDNVRTRNGEYASDTALMDGTYDVLIDGSWESEGQISFLARYPLPITIRALNVHLETTP